MSAMLSRLHVLVIVAVCSPALASAQSATVDFDRDVKPILREKCLSCHAGTQPQAGLRLDERRHALLGSLDGVVIVPGNSARSRLLWRISGTKYGPQMPPTGALNSGQIDVIRRWIDDGVPWPEAPTAARPVDARVTRLGEAFQSGDRAAIAHGLADTTIINLTSTEGRTPLMFAALYGSASDVAALLERGADPNVRSDAGLTALMLAATDAAKTQLLLAKGANVNLRSEDGRTALHIAAMSGETGIVKRLLNAGAGVNFNGGDSPLAHAATAGNVELVQMLIEAGAPVTRQAGVSALIGAANAECAICLDVLAEEAEPVAMGMALDAAADMGSVALMKQLLDQHAPIEAHDLFGGGTPLMLAAASERDALPKVRLLLERGADRTAKSELGETALEFAMRRNDQKMIAALGAPADGPASPSSTGSDVANAAARASARDARSAIERSIALLQKSDVQFVKSTGCISCHHDVLPQMLVNMARSRHLAVDQEIAEHQFNAVVSYLEDRRDRALQGLEIAGGPDTVSYLLVDLDAHGYAPTETTDAWARYLRMLQRPDGHWRITIHRPPIESSDIEVTAMSLRAMARYAPKAQRAEYDLRVRAGAAWLATAPASTNEDRTFRLLGLAWAGAPHTAIADAVRELRAAQRSDGGWAQIDTLDSDAYATGQALVALQMAGGLPVADAAYQRGVAYLRKTQHDDGSWLVRARTVALQPQFDSGFPGGRDQWISAAGTAWAAMALVLAVQ
jgi:ankyrin repeat protein